jgi:7,8-dihydropterin-6-yl-methyl-4-(beta-D-ribofuranosyl)aminobenzene 5'-phosphate synthase
MITKGLVVLAAVSGAGLSLRFRNGRRRVDSERDEARFERLDGLGTVSQLRILPLVDAEASRHGLMTESGVSYLVIADEQRILFDVGFNGRGPRRSPLLHNARALNVDLAGIDMIVISHPHPDHVGGVRPALRRSFAIPDATLRPHAARALTPIPMRHPYIRCEWAPAPVVAGPGVATTGTIARMLFFFGRTSEQALVANVEGKGVVVLVGCGHQGLQRLLARVESLVSAPIYGVVGGLHLPVHGLRAQDVLGTDKWPWQRTSERDAEEAVELLQRRSPRLIALSPHDSSQWTLSLFKRAFGGRYRTIRIGEEIVVGRAPQFEDPSPATLSETINVARGSDTTV